MQQALTCMCAYFSHTTPTLSQSNNGWRAMGSPIKVIEYTQVIGTWLLHNHFELTPYLMSMNVVVKLIL